ncbi:hypothetical protein [Pseudoalteromonas luteoviolacea]|uniref:Uncharacterized protein n=1 Tax=Pseudoalteromonas luteoviolacea NCIMB 1942 TaxID=1365253 RepID=A0A167GG59_9GAMM|nr:hypothetical protein [Pseudoalteromonas luteoviolacea]KZN55255.1 hypothetical protein N482_24350 [Pseudoalteromonas luteoviolacea NCIMB 1942]
MLKLDEYYSVLLGYNEVFFNKVLPSDELQELSQSASEDFKEDADRFNVLIENLSTDKTKEEAESALSELIALASGMEGLLRNVTDDARDLLRQKYRMEED